MGSRLSGGRLEIDFKVLCAFFFELHNFTLLILQYRIPFVWCFLNQQGVVQERLCFTECILAGYIKLERVVFFATRCFVSAFRMRLLGLRLQG